MVIHHDKMAYGKIRTLKDDMDEARLAAMAKKLSAEKEEGQEDSSEKSSADTQKNK